MLPARWFLGSSSSVPQRFFQATLGWQRWLSSVDPLKSSEFVGSLFDNHVYLLWTYHLWACIFALCLQIKSIHSAFLRFVPLSCPISFFSIECWIKSVKFSSSSVPFKFLWHLGFLWTSQRSQSQLLPVLLNLFIQFTSGGCAVLLYI